MQCLSNLQCKMSSQMQTKKRRDFSDSESEGDDNPAAQLTLSQPRKKHKDFSSSEDEDDGVVTVKSSYKGSHHPDFSESGSDDETNLAETSSKPVKQRKDFSDSEEEEEEEVKPTKNTPSGGASRPPVKTGHWSMGLLSSMNDPDMQIYKDEKLVIIKDKYPKAKFHYLIMPRVSIPSLKSLKPEHLDLLKHIHKKGKEVTEKHRSTGLEFHLGYHCVPSMSHLHMHAISQDFNSPCLKTKKHWNSFTTQYFVNSKDVIEQLEATGKVNPPSASKHAELLKMPLRCHVCHQPQTNMPKLKQHILQHIKS